MDLAKHLANWKERSPEQWAREANRYLPTGGTAILVLAIAYQLAALTWVIAPGAPPPARARATTAVEAAGAQAADYEALLHSHPFGEPDKVPTTPTVAEAVTDAPDTTLSLDLRGILAIGEADSGGQAIIAANRGEDKTYRVGQAIDNASGTKLYSVYWDKVLLDRGDGRVETLRLPKELLGTPAPRARGPVMAPPVAAPAPNESLRTVIGQNAAKLQDIIRVAPQIEQGKVVGFRVQPGKERATFDTLGLLPGDVVTEINGIVLDDPSKGLQAFEGLGEATQANVTVLREGAPQSIVVDTSQLQSLKENRQ
jgi:general secretion pathway protein C